MSFRRLGLALALVLAGAASSAAQTVKLEFVGGRVNLVAQNAPVRMILAEWARLGGTRIVNGDRVVGPPVTLDLQGYPERQALEILLRGVAGYMLAAREAAGTGASYFDRLMILPTSTAPRATPAAASLTPPSPPGPPMPIGADSDDDPTELPIGAAPGARPAPRPVNVGIPPGTITVQPGVPPAFEPDPAAGTRPPAPPGSTPPPPFGNPFTVLPGSSRPGEITPVPQQDARPGTQTAPSR